MCELWVETCRPRQYLQSINTGYCVLCIFSHLLQSQLLEETWTGSYSNQVWCLLWPQLPESGWCSSPCIHRWFHTCYPWWVGNGPRTTHQDGPSVQSLSWNPFRYGVHFRNIYRHCAQLKSISCFCINRSLWNGRQGVYLLLIITASSYNVSLKKKV